MTMTNASSDETYNVSFVPTVKTWCSNSEEKGGGFYIEAVNKSLTWDELVDVVLHEDRRRRKRLMPPDRFIVTDFDAGEMHGVWTDSKDGLCIIPSRIRKGKHIENGEVGTWRHKSLCEDTSILVLDIEDERIGDRQATILSWANNHFGVMTKKLIYTSWNHGVESPDKWKPGFPRVRIIMPLSRPVDSGKEYELLFNWADDRVDGVDSGCSDPSRASYTYRPKGCKDATIDPWFVESGLDPLDVDDLPGGVNLEDVRKADEARKKERQKRRRERMQKIQTGEMKGMPDTEKTRYFKSALKGMCDDIIRSEDRNKTIAAVSWKAGTMLQGLPVVDFEDVITVLTKAAEEALKHDRPDEDQERIVRYQVTAGMETGEPFDWTRLISSWDDFDWDDPDQIIHVDRTNNDEWITQMREDMDL